MSDPLRMRVSVGDGWFWVRDPDDKPAGIDDQTVGLEPLDPDEPSVSIDVEFPPGREEAARALLTRVFIAAHDAIDAFERAPAEGQYAQIRKARRHYGMQPLPDVTNIGQRSAIYREV